MSMNGFADVRLDPYGCAEISGVLRQLGRDQQMPAHGMMLVRISQARWTERGPRLVIRAWSEGQIGFWSGPSPDSADGDTAFVREGVPGGSVRIRAMVITPGLYFALCPPEDA